MLSAAKSQVASALRVKVESARAPVITGSNFTCHIRFTQFYAVNYATTPEGYQVKYGRIQVRHFTMLIVRHHL